MKKLVMFAAAALAALPLAAASPQKAGRWETTVEMEMPGVEMKMPPMTTAVCLTKADLDNPQKALPKLGESGCSVTDYKVSGNTATWSMKCDTGQGSLTGKGTITYSDDAYTGSMDLKMADQPMHAKLSGKYKGDCDGTEMKR